MIHMTLLKILYTIDNTITFVNNIGGALSSGGQNMKYTQEIKDKAVEAAKAGTSLAEIQRTIGPNPKAVQRYLVKAGIDYTKLKTELKAAGKLKEPFNLQGKAKKDKAAKDVREAAQAVPTEEIIEE